MNTPVRWNQHSGGYRRDILKAVCAIAGAAFLIGVYIAAADGPWATAFEGLRPQTNRLLAATIGSYDLGPQHDLVAGLKAVLLIIPATVLLAFALRPWIGRINWDGLVSRTRGGWKYVVCYFFALLLLGGIARGVLAGEPHHFDERAFLLQARIFSIGRFWAERPPMEIPRLPRTEDELNNFFVGFPQAEVLKGDRWFTTYGPLHPALLAPGLKLRVPWIVGPLCAAFVPLLVIGLAAEVCPSNRRAATAALVLSSPFWLFNGASYCSEATWLPVFSCFLWLWWRAYRRPSAGRFLWAGAALAASFLGREWATILSSAPMVFYSAWLGLRRREPIKAVWGMAPPLLAGAALYLVYNSILTGEPFLLARSLSGDMHLGFCEFHPFYAALAWAGRNLYVMSSDLWGWPLISLVPLAVYPFVAKKPSLFAKLFFAAVATNVIGNFFVCNDGIIYGARYYIGLLPGAAVLTADLAVSLVERRRESTAFRGHRREPAVFLAALFAALIAFNVLSYIPRAARWYESYPYRSRPWEPPGLKAALAEMGVTRAVVFMAPRERYRGAMPNRPDFREDIILARDQGPRNAEVMPWLAGRRYFLCDGDAFERTGKLVELAPPGTRR